MPRYPKAQPQSAVNFIVHRGLTIGGSSSKDVGSVKGWGAHTGYHRRRGGVWRERLQRPRVEVHTRRALAAISPIVDSSEPGDSQNADKHLEWLGHAYRFALGRWIGAVGWDTRRSRVLRRYLVPLPRA